MVNLVQTLLSLLNLSPSWQPQEYHKQPHSQANRSIAIVGAGSAGLAALKAILDLPLETRRNWSVVVFEQRRDVGGIWLPDPVPPHPPVLPATPLYPRLRINTPHPTMTYPGFTYPPLTPLFASHEYVLAYHQDYTEHFGLRQYIRFNHTVINAAWRGDGVHGLWDVQTLHGSTGNARDGVERHQFDHLIVASGHNHFPAVPHFPGADVWLENTPAGTPKRSILHSIFYREPSDYANRTVVVVGGGASGRDAMSQLEPIARKTYISLKENSTSPNPINTTVAIKKPPISHFSRNAVVFVDGTSASDPDSIILATGYNVLIPFLDAGGALRTDPSATSNNSTHGYTGLTTNLRYLFPLHEMIFSLSSQFPPTALSFIGLPVLIANCPSDRAQALLVAHAIANSSLLPSRGMLLARLADHEAELEAQGLDPYYVGHRLIGDGASEDYQDRIVQFLRDSGAIPPSGKKFVEQWRRDARKNAFLLQRAWARIESEGKAEERKWLEGITAEEDWARLMKRMEQWQREYEKERGEVVPVMNNAV